MSREPWRQPASDAQQRARKARRPALPAGVAVARFPDSCRVCGLAVARRDLVARDTLTTAWVHVDCADPSQVGGTTETRRNARRAARRAAGLPERDDHGRAAVLA